MPNQQRQIPEDHYLKRAIPGVYFRADDPTKGGIFLDVLEGFQFYHDPHCEYDGWCVVPFIDQEPTGITDVGSTTLRGFGSLQHRNANRQATHDSSLNYNPAGERFSRRIFAVKDERLPPTDEREPQQGGCFVFGAKNNNVTKN